MRFWLSRSHRTADRDLVSSSGCPGEEQVGDVGAGDQKHQTDGPEEGEERRSDRPDDGLLQRNDDESLAQIRVGEVLLEPLRDRVGLVLGLRTRHAVLETRDDVEVAGSADLGLGRVVAERYRGFGRPEAGRTPELGVIRKLEPRGMTPTTVNASPLSANGRPITDGSAPKRVTQKAWESTTTRSPPGVSLVGDNVLPSRGGSPRT